MEKSVSPRSSKVRETFGVERREQLLRLVNERGRVRTGELAQLLDVTEPTIRKDISDLESQGLIVRSTSTLEKPSDSRRNRQSRALAWS